MSAAPIWLTEADVVSLMALPDAIPALESVLAQEAQGGAHNMTKTHLTFQGHDTMHALGAASPGIGLTETKAWVHTAGGTAPLLCLWNTADGQCRAVIEAFALGQMRTGGISGLATKWLSVPDADEMAVIGSGRQAVTQVAAVQAVRPLKRLRVFSPTKENREAFARRMADEFGFEAAARDSVEDAVRDAPIVTCVTLARAPFLHAAMLAPGTHVNAVGAIVPERIEFADDIFARCAVVAVDSLPGVQNLSQEFRNHYGEGKVPWDEVTPVSRIVADGAGRPAGADLTLFKAMGMGLSDLAMANELLARAEAAGAGLKLPDRVRAQPRLRADN
ncbi:MAG: ornithine cyclodeaminase family protein [Alphaproteobacteria bacterium]|nr:ornithine cyclodeaminase family protein [Alphaproteobacteria bacterium]